VSTQHERNDAIDRLLRERRAHEPTTADCLDAEQAAAWFEGGLRPAERSRLEAHVADCDRCQALLGAVAQTVPTASAETRSASMRWLGWLLPVAAAAAIVVAVRLLPGESETASPAVPAEAVMADRADEAVPSPAAAELRDQARAEPPAPARQANELAKPAAPPAARAEETVGRMAAQAAAEAAPADALMAAIPSLVVPSSESGVQWRVQASSIERTIDGGTTWERSALPTGSRIVAGASPSASTCWLVGRGGLVLLTTDGVTWRRVEFPDTSDLSAVEAADARTATVTTADGRRFGTTDAGNSWSSRLLQEN